MILLRTNKHLTVPALIAFFTVGVLETPANSLSADEHLRQGLSLLQNRKAKESLSEFNAAIKLRPKSPAAYVDRAQAFLALKLFQKAIADVNVALKLDPNFSPAYAYRSAAFGYLNDQNKASEDADKAISLDSKSTLGFAARGLVHYRLKQFSNALADMNTAIELDHNRWQNFYIRALIYESLNEMNQAIADYQTAIQKHPSEPILLVTKARALLREKQYLGAVKDCSKAIELDEKNAAAFSIRASAYLMLNQFQKTIDDANAALKMDPNRAAAYVWRSLACAKIGKNEQAAKDREKSIKLDPTMASYFPISIENVGALQQALEKVSKSEKHFPLTADHIKLLRHTFIVWCPLEAGAPMVASDRPYGSLDRNRDMAEILNMKPEGFFNQLSSRQRENLEKLHRELGNAMEIFVQFGRLKPGGYSMKNLLSSYYKSDRLPYSSDSSDCISIPKSAEISFTFTDQHAKLLKAAFCGGAQDESGKDSVGMDPKRPYGQSTCWQTDMAHVLGETFDTDVEGQPVFSQSQLSRFDKLHKEMLFALQIFLQQAEMQPGQFYCSPTYSRWRRETVP